MARVKTIRAAHTRWAVAGMTTWALLSAAPSWAQGDELFSDYCAICHADDAVALSRAPDLAALQQLTPETILDVMTNGTMAVNAQSLSTDQRQVLAEFLAGRPFGSATSEDVVTLRNPCPSTPIGNPLQGPMWNGWGVDLGNSRLQPAEVAGLTAADVPRLTLKWAFGFPNASSPAAQPTVAGGRIYIGSDAGVVYALDAETGCEHWGFEAQAEVRTAASIGPVNGPGSGRYAVYFGDLGANVYAVDAETGEELWTAKADSHPIARITGAPTLYDGRLYVPVSSLEEASGTNPAYECCTFRGSVVAYDASTGEVIWKTFTIPEEPRPIRKNSTGTQLWAPAGAAIWSAPTIDVRRGLLYVATGDAYTSPAAETSDAVMALDLEIGRHVWVTQVLSGDAWLAGCPEDPDARPENCPEELGPDYDFGSSPILRTLPSGRDIIVIGQKSGIGWALDPENEGEVLWEHAVGQGSIVGGIQWGSAADDELVYFPNSDIVLGPSAAGGLAAVRMDTGERVWFTRPPSVMCGDSECVQGQSAAVTVIPGVVFSGSSNGIMRAYSTTDGEIIWEQNTVLEYSAVNGVAAKGGALNGPGATVVDGMLFMTSGYGYLGAIGGSGGPGNVLLAFHLE